MGGASGANAPNIFVSVGDGGSNSFRLMYAEVAPTGQVVGDPYHKKHSHQLGREMRRLNMLIPLSQSGAMVEDFMKFFIPRVKDGIDLARIYTTASFRDATNGKKMARDMSKELSKRASLAMGKDFKVTVVVISGEREAELIAAAQRANMDLEPVPVIGFDEGGGSCEIYIGDSQRLLWRASYGWGTSVLETQLSPRSIAKSLTKNDQIELAHMFRDSSSELDRAVSAFRPQRIIVSSGTFKALVRISHYLRHKKKLEGKNMPVTREPLVDVLAACNTLIGASRSQRERLLDAAGVNLRRVDDIAAGAFLFTDLSERSGVLDTDGDIFVTFSPYAMLHGVAMDIVKPIGHLGPSRQEQNVQRALTRQGEVSTLMRSVA